MNKKIRNILKIIILFILLIISNLEVYAYEYDMDKRIEMTFDKIETEEGTFYKRKKTDPKDVKRVYSISGNIYSEENKEVVKIINEKIDEYMTRFTSEACPENQRIEKEYTKNIINIYSVTEEKKYNNGDEISVLISVFVSPINFENDYWKNNFSNNDISYNAFEDKYYVYMNYYIRLDFNKEKNEYEIAYIDFKPENLEEELTKLKEEKGLDLENLKIEDIMNISYDDQINVVSSSESTAVSAEKIEYNANQIEEISNTAKIIRYGCIGLIVIIVLAGIIKVWKEK